MHKNSTCLQYPANQEIKTLFLFSCCVEFSRVFHIHTNVFICKDVGRLLRTGWLSRTHGSPAYEKHTHVKHIINTFK